MKKSTLKLLIQYTGDGISASTIIALYAIDRFCFDSIYAPKIAISTSAFILLGAIFGLSRDTLYLKHISEDNIALARNVRSSILILQLALLSVFILGYFAGIFPIEMSVGILYAHYVATSNELRFDNLLGVYIISRFLYFFFVTVFFYFGGHYGLTLDMIWLSSFGLLFTMLIVLRRDHVISHGLFESLRLYKAHGDFTHLSVYRFLTVGWSHLENLIVMHVLGSAVLGLVGAYKEFLKIFSFLFQGMNRAFAVELSKKYLSEKLVIVDNYFLINILILALSLFVTLFLNEMMFFILVGIAVFGNLQHRLSYAFFARGTVSALNQIYFLVIALIMVVMLCTVTSKEQVFFWRLVTIFLIFNCSIYSAKRFK